MIQVLMFVALWCEPNETNRDIQSCRDRLIKCASRSTPIGLVFSQYDTDLYYCAKNEKIK